MWVMAWQRVSCLVTYLSTPSTPSLLHDKLHPQLDQDRWRWRLNCLRSRAAFAKRELLKRDKQRLNESCLNWAFCCNVFSLKSVTLWCQSKWAWRPERPRGEAERSGQLGLPLNTGGPFHFLSPGSPRLRKLRGFDFFSFPPLTPFLVGVQECSQGSTSAASCGHFLTPRNKTSTQQSRIDSCIVAGTLRWEAKSASQSACVLSRNYASEILSKL